MIFFFFSSRRRHTRLQGDWSSDVCSSDLIPEYPLARIPRVPPGANGRMAAGIVDQGYRWDRCAAAQSGRIKNQGRWTMGGAADNGQTAVAGQSRTAKGALPLLRDQCHIAR